MKKIYFILLFVFSCISYVDAQQRDFDWRIGVSGGYTNYYGDLTPFKVNGLRSGRPFYHMLYFNENYFDRLSYRVSLERQLNPTVGFEIHYGFYEFAMSDRYVQRDGSLYTANPNWARGLNFQNRSRDLGLSFVFKSDNDRFLSSESFLAPYLSLGAGILLFDVWGDLRNDSGQRYNHFQGGNIHNGVYETNLPPLHTELEGGYNLTTFYTSLGLGFRIRLSSALEIFAQSNLMYTFSDYLDDVSGSYRETYETSFQEYAARPGTNTVDPQTLLRGDPNSPNDWIIYHGIGLKINFGKNRKAFSAPRLSTFYPDYSPTAVNINSADSVEDQSEPTTGNSYTYNIFNIGESQKLDSLIYKTQIQEWRQEIQQRENSLLANSIRQNELRNLEQLYTSQNEALRADSKLTPEERDRLLEENRNPSLAVMHSLDSIQRSENQLKAEIDSLNQQIKEHRPQHQRLYLLPNNDTLPMGNFNESLAPAEEAPLPERTQTQQQDVLQRTNDSSVSNDTSGRYQQQFQPIVQPIGTNSQTYQQQLDQMTRENRYLRNERDRLIYAMYGQQRVNQNNQQAPMGYGSNPVATLPSQEAERRRRWWPFAAAGGALAASSARANNNVEGVPVSPRELPDSLQQRIDHTALAVTSAQLGLPVSSGMNIQNPPTATQIEVRDSIVYKTDTLVVEREIEKLVYPTKTNIFFEVNQQQANPEELAKLRDLVEAAKQSDDKQLVLTAYTDNTGNVAYNLKLAEQRVESVKDALIELFDLTPDQIRIELGGQVVRGPQRRSNDLDRRVEVRLDRKE